VGAATEYEFEVQHAFYQTRRFYAAMAVGIGLLLWGVWQLRVRALHTRYALIMNERTRIGQEIHDTVLQNMAGVALEIEGVARKLQRPGPEASQALTRISQDIKEHLAEVRQTIRELRTSEHGTASLEQALREAGDWVRDRSQMQFELAVFGTPRACSHDVERELIRIAREALRNSVRHSGGTSVRVELRYADDCVRVVISDDGQGFDVAEHSAGDGNHWGLVGMRERASRINAELNIESRAGTGTTIDVSIPCVTTK
jgi:signal transduction histidine kinase